MPSPPNAHWWDALPSENVFMEITRRDDIGGDLLAPLNARGGAASGGYVLVPCVQPGNVVVHYDGRGEEIVGASRATGEPESAAINWVARGASARRAGAEQSWVRAIRVPLGGFTPLEPALSLQEIRRHQDELLRIRAHLQEMTEGSRVYFPWIPYGDGPIRSFQAYLVKLPQAAVDLFPSLRRLVDRIESEAADGAVGTAADVLDDQVEIAAGRTPTRRRGQGFQSDLAVRVAIESYAMNAAIKYFSREWTVEDVHTRESFDLLCRRGDEVRFVEVKGTSGDGSEVIVTRGEVAHAREEGSSILYVLAHVEISVSGSEQPLVGGGSVQVIDPWVPDQADLTPVGFRYRVPTD